MKAGLATSLSIAGVLATGGAALVLNSSILDTESSAKGSPAFATVVGIEAQGGVTPLGGGANPSSAAGLSASSVVDAINGGPAPLANPVVVETVPEVLAAGAPAPASSGASTGTTSPATASGSAGGIKQSQAKISATETTVDTSPSTSAPAPSTTSPAAPSTTSPAPTTTVAPVEKQFKVGEAATITLVINGSKLLVKDIAIVPGSGFKVTNQFSRDGDDVRITLTSPTRVIEFSARLVNGRIVAGISAPSSGNLNPPRPPRRDDDHEGREHDEDHEEREREHDDDDD